MNRLPVAKVFVIGCLTMNRLTLNRHHQTGLRLTRYWVVSDYPQTGLGLTMNRLAVVNAFVIGCLTMPRLTLNRHR